MDLINAIKNKDYNSIKQHCADKIAGFISDKIITSKNTFVAKAKGLTLEEFEKKLEEEKMCPECKKDMEDCKCEKKGEAGKEKAE